MPDSRICTYGGTGGTIRGVRRSLYMKFEDNKDGSFFIFLPLKNDGKFRWKKRDSYREYGQSFPTTYEPYSCNAYVEWQVGYDFPINTRKLLHTNLEEKTFIGANKKEKYPYELSEIIHHMMERRLLSKNELAELIRSIEDSDFFLDEQYPIKTEAKGSLQIGGITFVEEIISLPTFVYVKHVGEPVIEVSIQKQQYATGVQPMVYFSIPILCLEKGESYLGRTYKALAVSEQEAKYLVNKETKHYFTTLFKIFEICSENHKHDVDEILKLIKSYF